MFIVHLIFSVRSELFQLCPGKKGVETEVGPPGLGAHGEAIVSGFGYSTPAGRPLSCCKARRPSLDEALFLGKWIL